MSELSDSSGCSTLTAKRFVFRCVAAYTTAMPPIPSTPSMRYLPRSTLPTRASARSTRAGSAVMAERGCHESSFLTQAQRRTRTPRAAAQEAERRRVPTPSRKRLPSWFFVSRRRPQDVATAPRAAGAGAGAAADDAPVAVTAADAPFDASIGVITIPVTVPFTAFFCFLPIVWRALRVALALAAAAAFSSGVRVAAFGGEKPKSVSTGLVGPKTLITYWRRARMLGVRLVFSALWDVTVTCQAALAAATVPAESMRL